LSSFEDQADFSSRLEFLFKAVEDTQATIRFIDTKAAFCVTLLSGMVAGAIETSHGVHAGIQRIVFALFLASVGVSLLICLRVIFPVIKPHSAAAADATRALPKFFIHQGRGHHWIRHTFSNSVDDVLADNHASYLAAISAATDVDLITSMSDELLMVSLIRQIKSDRLHTAMFSLVAAIALFLAVMIV
jgi:hypothetical protein